MTAAQQEQVPDNRPAAAPPSQDEIARRVAYMDGFVRFVVQQCGRDLQAAEKEDLQAAGRMGALMAAQRFDPGRGLKFDTYAGQCIRMCVMDEVLYIRRRGRLPQAAREMIWNYNKARAVIEASGQEASPARLAEYLGLDEDLVIACLRTEDVEMDDQAHQVEQDVAELLIEREDLARIQQAITHLSDREKFIVQGVFFEGRTRVEIAQDLGLTSARVGQIEKDALARIRKRVLSSTDEAGDE